MANDKKHQQPRDPVLRDPAVGQVVQETALPRPEQGPSLPAPPPKPSPPAGAPSPVPVPAAEWVVEAESYLKAHAWEKVEDDGYGGSRWRDPEGSAEPLPPNVVTLPNREGPPHTVEQTRVRPHPWEYSLAAAVRTQRERDVEGGASPPPLERLDRLGRAFTPAVTALDLVAEELEECVRLDVPRGELAPRLYEYVAKLSARLGVAAGHARKAATEARAGLADTPQAPHQVGVNLRW